MRSEPAQTTTEPSVRRQRDLIVILVALGVAVILTRIVGQVTRTGGIPSPVLQVLAADAAVWVPLVVAAAVVLRRTDRKSVV